MTTKAATATEHHEEEAEQLLLPEESAGRGPTHPQRLWGIKNLQGPRNHCTAHTILTQSRRTCLLTLGEEYKGSRTVPIESGTPAL